MTQTPSSPGASGAVYPPPGTDVPGDRGSVAKQDAAEVAETAKQGASEVAQEAGAQARQMAGTAKDHARDLFDQTTSEVRQRANHEAHRAAGALEELASRAQALISGRPEDAGPLRDYVEQLGERARRTSEQLRNRGADGVVADVRSFARRRPGAFLAGAAAAGFLVGRLVKAQRAGSSGDRQPSSNGRRQWTPEAPVYGAAPVPEPEMPVQPYPTPGLEEYPAAVTGSFGSERRS